MKTDKDKKKKKMLMMRAKVLGRYKEGEERTEGNEGYERV